MKKETFAQRLNRLRTYKKMTLKQAAGALGIPVSTYRDWEYGREIKGEPYLKLAEIYEVSVYELLSGQRPRRQDFTNAIYGLIENVKTLEKIERTLF